MARDIQFATDQAGAMAEFIAGLEKHGVSYDVENMRGGWRVLVYSDRESVHIATMSID